MTEDERQRLLRDLRDVKDAPRFLAATKRIHEVSTRDDLPWLMSLLNDPEFTIREAAAWPLAELAGLAALPQLLQAYQRGIDDGHDNDGLTTAMIELVEADRAEARAALNRLIGSSDPSLRDNAKWLVDFCQETN